MPDMQYTMGVAFYLTCTVTLSFARACSCHQSNAYFKGIPFKKLPCGFSCLAQMLSIDALAVRTYM